MKNLWSEMVKPLLVTWLFVVGSLFAFWLMAPSLMSRLERRDVFVVPQVGFSGDSITKAAPAGDVLMATNNFVTNTQPVWDRQPIVWEYDKIRENNRLAKEEALDAHQFNATNVNRMIFRGVSHWPVDFGVIQSDRELGYRSDGVVVWRLIPEKTKP